MRCLSTDRAKKLKGDATIKQRHGTIMKTASTKQLSKMKGGIVVCGHEVVVSFEKYEDSFPRDSLLETIAVSITSHEG